MLGAFGPKRFVSTKHRVGLKHKDAKHTKRHKGKEEFPYSALVTRYLALLFLRAAWCALSLCVSNQRNLLRSGMILTLFMCVLTLSGCGRGKQSDLELESFRFNYEGQKAVMYGTIRNTGSQTYKSVFLVADLYQGDEKATQIKTNANLSGQMTLAPGQTASCDAPFEDGGFKPNRVEVVRLYGSK